MFCKFFSHKWQMPKYEPYWGEEMRGESEGFALCLSPTSQLVAPHGNWCLPRSSYSPLPTWAGSRNIDRGTTDPANWVCDWSCLIGMEIWPPDCTNHKFDRGANCKATLDEKDTSGWKWMEGDKMSVNTIIVKSCKLCFWRFVILALRFPEWKTCHWQVLFIEPTKAGIEFIFFIFWAFIFD